MSSALLAGGCAARGVRVRVIIEASRQVWATLFVIGGPRGSHGRGRQMGPDAPFWIRAARHEATTPDSAAREGLCGSAEYLSVRVACRLRELRSYGDTPARVRRLPRGGSMRFPNLDRIWTESGRGRSTGGRGRSNEIEGDRTDFADLRRSSPIFADLRSFSPASGVLDPIWAILKPLN